MFSTKWQLWLGLAVSAGLLIVLLYQVDLGELRQALVEANYVYVAPAVALYFVAVWFRAVRWRYLLEPLRAFPVRRLYPVVVIGYMANNLLPMRLGELVRAYYLGRQENFSASSALGTIAVERLFDGVCLLALAALSAPWLLAMGEFDGAADISHGAAAALIGGAGAAFGVFLVVFTLLAVSPAFAGWIEKRLDLLPARLRPPAVNFFRTFVAGLRILNSPRKHLALLVYSVPVWLAEAGVYLLIAYSFNLDSYFGSTGAFFLAAILLTATSNLATAAPSAIGGIGPFEVVAQQTLVALGVGASVAGAYSGFVHLAALWLPVNLVGLALLWKQNLSLKQLAGAWREEGLGPAAGIGGPAAGIAAGAGAPEGTPPGGPAP